MSSAIDRPKVSLKAGLSAWLTKIGVPFIVVLEIAVGATQSDSFAANPLARKTERNLSVEADDQTFSPTAKISASVGKGGNNAKQDVLLVKRLLSKFGYELTLNGDADAALNSAIGKFQDVYMPAAKTDQRIDPAGQTWKTLLGIGRIKGSLDELSKKYDVEPAVILAIQSVESGNNGYLPDGRPKILFEGHVFWRMLKAAGKNPAEHVQGNEDILFEKQDRSKYIGGAAEWVRLEKAEKIDHVAALKSASWGEFQIMGFNHKTVGYPDVDSFVESISQPGAGQIRAVLAFMDNNKLLPLVRGPNKKWDKFAAAYNGAGYKKNFRRHTIDFQKSQGKKRQTSIDSFYRYLFETLLIATPGCRELRSDLSRWRCPLHESYWFPPDSWILRSDSWCTSPGWPYTSTGDTVHWLWTGILGGVCPNQTVRGMHGAPKRRNLAAYFPRHYRPAASRAQLA